MGRVFSVGVLQAFTCIIVASFLIGELKANPVSSLTAEPTSNLSDLSPGTGTGTGSQTHVEAGSYFGHGLSNLWNASTAKVSSFFSSISSMVYGSPETTETKTEPQSNKTNEETVGKQPEPPTNNKSETPNSTVEIIATVTKPTPLSQTVKPEPTIIVPEEETTTSQIPMLSRTTERASSTTITAINSQNNAVSVVALKTVTISSLIVNMILVAILIVLIMYDRMKCSKLEMRICSLTNQIMKDHFEGGKNVYSDQ